jgi:acetyl esterase/lipase
MDRVLAHRPLRATLTAALVLGTVAAVGSTPAAANVPPPILTTNPVRVPAHGNTTNGIMSTRVTYTDTTASATVSTGATVTLGKGWSFRLRTCVAYHLNAMPPESRCAERSVDTRANADSVFTYAPRVTLARQPRPTTEPWGYFTTYTEVLYLSGSTWSVAAHSWPDDGLQTAGIAVAPQGQDYGTLPPSASTKPDGGFTSAVSSGQPDSVCAASPAVSDGSPLPAGVSTDHPAFPDAPGYYEVGLPTGQLQGQTPRGVMLVLHGGGWAKTGAQRWRNRGWETVNFTYRSCGQSLDDTLWFYDHARAWFDPGLKICALGTSAGGHLALLIGANRPGLYCVVNQAGPTDLLTIQGEFAFDVTTGLASQTSGGRVVRNLAASAFGDENLARFSPAALASGTLNGTRVLQGFSADDPLVSFQQAADLASAMQAANPGAYVDELQLGTGTIPFAHGRVTQAALDDFYAREQRLVEPVTGPPTTAPVP